MKEKVDLVISLKSMGYHYPLENYLNLFKKNCSRDTIFIFDISKGNYEIISIKKIFKKVEVIYEENSIHSLNRVCCKDLSQFIGQLKFIFRADNTNVGDWWCPPFRYFPFKPSAIGDILNSEFEIKKTDTLIIGGGGIGSEFFEPHLERIKSLNAKSTILWGAGVDSFSDKSKTLENSKHDLYGSYFDFIDEVGIRVFSLPQNYRYVPCASCMNNLFFKYREVKPSNTVGVYNHKRDIDEK